VQDPSIELDDAMILPHAANLNGSNFRNGHGLIGCLCLNCSAQGPPTSGAATPAAWRSSPPCVAPRRV
jgi:hypothetical protein